MAKAIIFRFLFLAVLLVLMNFIYDKFLYEKDLLEHSPIINLLRDAADADVVYLGESSNITFKESDIDKRPISAFVADYFQGLTVKDITWPASHAGIYKQLLYKIPESSNIKTVVVTLNLRSFNANWTYSTLETSLQKSLVLLRDYPPLLNRFLLSFKSYDIKSEKERSIQFKEKWKNDVLNFPYPFPHKNVIEWDKWMAGQGVASVDGQTDKAKTSLACHYIKTYAFQINPMNNQRIKDFDEIIELSKKRGWNLVFNLLAENTEKANQLVGDDLIYLMEGNRKILKSHFENQGIAVVDNFNEIKDEEFIDQDWTTEHYAEH
nr:DUF4843 domain-containing protein [Bacteroidota bacterium]